MSNSKLISTSALVKKLSITKRELDELLLAAKYYTTQKTQDNFSKFLIYLQPVTL